MGSQQKKTAKTNISNKFSKKKKKVLTLKVKFDIFNGQSTKEDSKILY